MSTLDQKLIAEAYGKVVQSQLINEVDWNKFSDTQKVCLSVDDVADYLNKELDRLRTPSKDRPKPDARFARISRGNIPTDEEGKAVISEFINQLTKKPKTIFDEGEKSKHTLDEKHYTINTGIPALRAVLWDEENKQFYIINTCKGAQACVKYCYALQGFYIMNDGKNIKLAQRLQMMMNHPDEYENIAFLEAELAAFKAKREDKTLQIRWNDAGDFYSDVYFDIAVNVTKRLQEKGYSVESYAYTKTGKYVELGKQHGFTINFSSGASEQQKKLVSKGTVKESITVPDKLFRDLFVTSKAHFQKDETGKTLFREPISQSRKTLKHRIYDNYKDSNPNKLDERVVGLEYESLVYTDELPKERGLEFKYNVIVLPSGDSDAPAQRKDVQYTFLLEH